MKNKIVEWQPENLYQRIQTAWTFIRASFRILYRGKVAINVKFKNL